MPPHAPRTSLIAAVLFVLAPFPASLYTTNNGIDAIASDAKESPRRSISRTIANAVAGDTVIVGPAASGDLTPPATAVSPNFDGSSEYSASSTDAFVTKFNGSGVIYSTYLGGSTETAPFLGSVARLDTTQSGVDGLVWSTFLGGKLPTQFVPTIAEDSGFGIAPDGTGNVYVAGVTRSTDFPVKNALDGTILLEEVGCIDNSVISRALISKLAAAQAAIDAGKIPAAINRLNALLQQLEAQAGKHIATTCMVRGVTYDPVQVLIDNVKALLASLGAP